MIEVTFIGDVHGKIDRYLDIVANTTETIQIGDLGVGFMGRNEDRLSGIGHTHRFIRGNHDNPSVIKTMENYIPDGHYDKDLDMMFIGGGLSIDKAYRIHGVSWWPDEEISIAHFESIINSYETIKPRYVASHECPETAAINMFPFYRREFPSRTRQALDAMWKIHQPDVWIFGHWHHSTQKVIDKTKFICLDELETLKMEF
jgi:predicted phosphodiesterase